MKAGNKAPNDESFMPPIKIAINIKGAILTKEKLILLICSGILTLFMWFLIIYNAGILIIISKRHKIIGIKPWDPKRATISGPTANPIEIEEL